MLNKTNFLKKIDSKKSKTTFNVEKIRKETKVEQNSQGCLVQLNKKDIAEFQYIGIFDKKVIVTYHNRLQIFGYFDFHAIHQRIRYEYYVWKLLAVNEKTDKQSPFDDEVIQKEGKMIKQIFNEKKKILIKIDDKIDLFFHEQKSNFIEIWGIQLQMNSSCEIYATAYRPILGKNFTNEQVREILRDSLKYERKTVPKVIDDWIGQFSCKSAYKFNDNLPVEKARLLIKNLQKCEFPWHCVHGRNTIHIKSVKEDYQ